MGCKNEMRWDCEKDGCFNIRCRPKLAVFADCFPGKIGFGDVDALVEIGGNFLFLEWKSGQALPTGQRITYERLTAPGRNTTVVVICGDAETMRVDSIMVFHGGQSLPWEACTLDGLKERIAKWTSRSRRARVENVTP